MEIVNENAAMLSNFEVYNLLQDIESGTKGQQKTKLVQNNLWTISYSSLKFLKDTPCKHQSAEIIQEFMQKVAPFKLKRAEKLQLLNQRPTTAVEIQLLIEESEERMTEEQIDQLLEIVATCLPGDDPVVVEEGEEQEEEQDMDQQQSL